MQILIINVHSADNAGDLALLRMAIEQLRAVFPQARFVISANYPGEAAVQREGDAAVASPWALAGGGTNRKPRALLLRLALGWLLARAGLHRLAGRWGSGWAALFAAYRAADLVAAVPGNQFFSSGRRGWPLLAIALAVDLAAVFHKPVYILPQSVGPFRYGWEYRLLRRCYARARIVFLRDLQSIEVAKTAGLPAQRVRFAPDPAFALPAAPREQALELLQSYGYAQNSPAIGVTVIAAMPGYLDQRQIDFYYTAVANALSAMIQRHACHVFFFYQVIGPSPQEDDRIATALVVQKMRAVAPSVHVIEQVLDPALLKACYGWMELFLASRLHSGIFAMAAGVPCVCIGYLHKTRGVLEALNLQDHVIDLKDLPGTDLLGLLEQTWDRRVEQRAALEQTTAAIIEQAQAVGPAIQQDFGTIHAAVDHSTDHPRA